MNVLNKNLLPIACLALASCGPNNVSVGTGGGTTSATELPGTENPTAGGSIIRFHERDESDGDYYLDSSVEVQDGGATIIVEGMPYDGDADRYTQIGTIGDFALYENADKVAFDPIDGDPIPQLDYLAVHQESANGLTYVTIVASSAPDRHGLDGFVFGRNGGVTLPTTDQARYEGTYAGLRTFEEETRIETISADIVVTIDFENLNSAGAFTFSVTNRVATPETGPTFALPDFGGFAENFALDNQGEFEAEGETGVQNSASFDPDSGEWTTTEGGISAGAGTIHGVLAGSNAQTIAGVLVLEGGDYIIGDIFLDADGLPDAGGDQYFIEDTDLSGTVNETGAFIVNR